METRRRAAGGGDRRRDDWGTYQRESVSCNNVLCLDNLVELVAQLMAKDPIITIVMDTSKVNSPKNGLTSRTEEGGSWKIWRRMLSRSAKSVGRVMDCS